MMQVLDPAMADAIRALVPVIETARLCLRAPSLADYPAYEAVFTSDRAVHVGGPFDAEASFNDFAQAVAGWMLLGSGAWTITEKGSDVALGWIYLWQEFGDPEPEFGWILTAEAEGRGIATEAARAVLPRAMALFGPGGVVSYIDPPNLASIRIAEKLGAQRDPVAEAALSDWGMLVYRHFAGKETP